MNTTQATLARMNLVAAGWHALSANVYERNGFTALLNPAAGVVTMINPIGKRAVRSIGK